MPVFSKFLSIARVVSPRFRCVRVENGINLPYRRHSQHDILSKCMSTIPSMVNNPPNKYQGTPDEEKIRYTVGNFEVDYATMPVVETMDSRTLDKLLEYSTKTPRPVSIEELIAAGEDRHYTEQQSYCFLRQEVAVRLAHMIMELQHLPHELHAEAMCQLTISKYSQSFSQAIQFENRDPTKENLTEFMDMLVTFKSRHENTVHDMAKACLNMKERLNISVSSEHTDDSTSLLFSSIKLLLDRMYTSRIGIHMITNQHLDLFSTERVAPNNRGIIRPNCDLKSILSDAHDSVAIEFEDTYSLVAPLLDLQVHRKGAGRGGEACAQGHCVPSHLTLIFKEVLKNSMRATVEHHLAQLKEDPNFVLPGIKALVCQADDDFTIKISDQGGGMDRDSAAAVFSYEYCTLPKAGVSVREGADKQLGYGLPLAKLYARYFNGDLRLASYEGYGTDVYIYTRALASTARERLPIYNPETINSLSWSEFDWTSGPGSLMINPPDAFTITRDHGGADTDTAPLAPEQRVLGE